MTAFAILPDVIMSGIGCLPGVVGKPDVIILRKLPCVELILEPIAAGVDTCVIPCAADGLAECVAIGSEIGAGKTGSLYTPHFSVGIRRLNVVIDRKVDRIFRIRAEHVQNIASLFGGLFGRECLRIKVHTDFQTGLLCADEVLRKPRVCGNISRTVTAESDADIRIANAVGGNGVPVDQPLMVRNVDAFNFVIVRITLVVDQIAEIRTARSPDAKIGTGDRFAVFCGQPLVIIYNVRGVCGCCGNDA